MLSVTVAATLGYAEVHVLWLKETLQMREFSGTPLILYNLQM